MGRYIDADELKKQIDLVQILVMGGRSQGKSLLNETMETYKKAILKKIDEQPTADVVPKSEVERLTINMNAYGLTAKRLAEENESLEIELENMRRNLGDAREGWNDAECEVERLRKALDEYEETSGLKQGKAEVAREIFEEIETLLALNSLQGDVFTGKYFDADLENDIAEFKKKYTEVVE